VKVKCEVRISVSGQGRLLLKSLMPDDVYTPFKDLHVELTLEEDSLFYRTYGEGKNAISLIRSTINDLFRCLAPSIEFLEKYVKK